MSGSHYNFKTLIMSRGLLLLFAWLLSHPAWAANHIEIRVDKTRMIMGDLLRCEVEVVLEDEDRVGDIHKPSFDGFKVLNENTSHQHYTSIVNFQMTSRKTVTTTYLLQPLRLGELTIGPASLKEDGRLVESNRVVVTVSELSGESGGRFFGDDAVTSPLSREEGETPGFFVRLIPEKSELYRGEQMAVTLYLYTAADVSVNRWGQVAPPPLSEFGPQRLEIPKKDAARSVVLNRRTYQVEMLDRILLTALKPGVHVIVPYQVKLLADDGRSFFSGRWVNRATAPIEITVRELPLEGRPPGFAPANVGQFKLTATVDRRKTEVNQPVALQVTLVGNADTERVRLPKLPEIPGAKIYPPSEKKQSFQKGTRIVGKRSSEYLIVPSRPGRFTIPPLSFDYFSTEEGVYKTLKTPAFGIRVVEASEAVSGAAGLSRPVKQDLELEEGALRPLKPTAQLANRNGRFFGSGLFLLLFWGPLGLIAAVGLVDAFRLLGPRLSSGERARLEREIKRLGAALAARAGRNDIELASDLRRLIHLELEGRLGEPVAGLTHDRIDARLDEAGVSEALRKETIALLEICDLMSYAPGGVSENRGLVDRAGAWSKELRK